jgi:TrmH family RNA methyltransferase
MMNTRTILSADNKALKEARKLKDRTGRRKAGAFLVEGYKLIAEARAAGLAIEKLYVRDGEAEAAELAESLTSGDRINLLPDHLFEGLTETVTPQPMAAVVIAPAAEPSLTEALASVADRAGKGIGELALMVMDRISDPGNAGAIVRTSLAAEMNGVIALKGTVDLFSGKSLRSSAGSVFHIPVIEEVDEEEFIGVVRNAGAELIALSAEGENLYDADLTGGCILVVGNEANGLSPLMRKAATRAIAIPMNEKAESLNAGIAAAVVMFERMRQEVRRR